MDSDPGLSARLEEIAEKVARLEQRVAQLERSAPTVGRAAAEALAEVEAVPALPLSGGSALDLTMVGRSIIVLGGGYLLRAITALDSVPDVLGVGAGLLYGLVLLLLADRAAARGREASSALHALTSVLIVYPLLGETVLRFHLVDPWAGSLSVTAWSAVASLLAARRRAVPFAWITVAGTVVATVALALATRTVIPYMWTMVAVIAIAAWLGHRLGQRFLVWPAAIAGDVLLAAVLAIVLSGHVTWGWMTSPLLALLFFLMFAVGAMSRSAIDRAATSIVEMTQCSVALALGFVGGSGAATVLGWGRAYAAVGVALAGAGTVVTLRLFGRREDRATLPFWTSLWLLAGIIALGSLLPPLWLAAVMVGLGVALLAAGPRVHFCAELHGLCALVVAAVASGLGAWAWHGLIGPPEVEAPELAGLAALAALLGATLLLFRRVDDSAPLFCRVVRFASLVVFLALAAGALAAACIALTGASRAVAGSLRTGVLAVGAVALAAASRSPRGRAAATLVVPLLGIAAVKVLLEDFVVGVAATQFAGLALFGVALIVAPRLRRREPTTVATTTTPSEP